MGLEHQQHSYHADQLPEHSSQMRVGLAVIARESVGPTVPGSA